MDGQGRTFVIQLLRFHVVGIGTLIVGTAVFLGLVWSGAGYVSALAGDYAAGILFSYFMNKKFTFRVEVANDTVPLLVTALSYLITFLLNLAALAIAVEVYQLHMVYSQVVIMLVLALLNFLVMKFWVFGAQASQRDTPDVEEL